jgi:hypothetical protein
MTKIVTSNIYNNKEEDSYNIYEMSISSGRFVSNMSGYGILLCCPTEVSYHKEGCSYDNMESVKTS